MAITRPNILVISTQLRLEGLGFMPNVANTWCSAGRVYTNHFTTTALGGVSRINFLTGQLATVHGYQSHHDPDPIVIAMNTNNIGSKLRHVGYQTGMFGQFGYSYETLGPPNTAEWYIPPGWDKWWVNGTDVPFAFLSYTIVKDVDVTETFGSADADFFTDVLADEVAGWITTAEADPGDRPWFAYVAIPQNGIPTRHVGRYDTVPDFRPVSFNEADVSDKVQGIQDLDPVDPDFVDETRITQVTGHLAIDDLCLQLYNHVTTIPNTAIIFLGQGGTFWGEHRLGARETYPGDPSPWLRFAGNQPYDEAHRTPLIVIYPEEFTPNSSDERLLTSQDVTATIADWAGAASYLIDGISFARTSTEVRREIPLEGWGSDGEDFYMGTRTRTNKVITWTHADADGKIETYNLLEDPFELNSST